MDKYSDIVKIGVSGHRFLNDTFELRNSIFEVLENIYTRHNHSKFQIFSPLAIGADQLVAECGLENPTTRLIVLLPMPMVDYLEGFSAREKTGFMRLFNRREEMIQLPHFGKKDGAYLKMGDFLLDSIDYLIIMWNGKPARGIGGTAQIVKLARQMKLPTAWIRAHNAVPGSAIPLDQQLEQGSIEYENWNRVSA
jgi:hypothetical protein